MDILLQNGDQALDHRGLPRTVGGGEELAQQAMIRLCVPKGRFAPDPSLGSRLYRLARASHQQMAAQAEEYVREALAPMPQAQLMSLSCRGSGDGAVLTLVLALGNDVMEMEVTV